MANVPTQCSGKQIGLSGADPGGGGVGGHDPPCSRPPIFFFNKLFNYMVKGPRVGVFVIFWRADDVTRTRSKGGCLWMSKSGGICHFFEGGWRHADKVQGGGCLWMSKSGGICHFLEGGWRHADNVQEGVLVNVLTPPPPFQEILDPRLPIMTKAYSGGWQSIAWNGWRLNHVMSAMVATRGGNVWFHVCPGGVDWYYCIIPMGWWQ